jgi:hypothetical protein
MHCNRNPEHFLMLCGRLGRALAQNYLCQICISRIVTRATLNFTWNRICTAANAAETAIAISWLENLLSVLFYTGMEFHPLVIRELIWMPFFKAR